MPFSAGCAPLVPPFYCENDISQTIKSPDGAHGIVVFSRGCGATTSDSTQIALLSSSSKWGTEAGEVMAFDEENVVVRWKDAKTVEISFPNRVKHLWKEPVVDGIQFQYKHGS